MVELKFPAHFPVDHLMALLLLLLFPSEFFTSMLTDGLSQELSDSKSPKVSRTLLSIMSVVNHVVVWMVSTRPPTSKSCSPFSNPLVTVPKARITIGIIATFMFHSFFQFSSKVKVFILLFIFFQFYSVISRNSKVDNFEISLFLLLIIIRSGPLAEIK